MTYASFTQPLHKKGQQHFMPIESDERSDENVLRENELNKDTRKNL